MLKYSNQITIRILRKPKNFTWKIPNLKNWKELKRWPRWNNPIRFEKSRVSHSVTGSRGYTTRSHNAATRFRWASRPNPRKTRLLSANWYRALTQFRSGGPCRGGLSRVRVPPRGVLSLCLCPSLCRLPFGNWTRYTRSQSGCPLWPRIVTDFTIGRCNFAQRFTDRWSFPSLSLSVIQQKSQCWAKPGISKKSRKSSSKRFLQMEGWIIVRIEFDDKRRKDVSTWNEITINIEEPLKF